MNQKGFAPVLIVLGIALVIGAGIIGAWYTKIIQIPGFAPPGCYYQKVQCIQAPCNPVLVCSTPTPSISPIKNTANETVYIEGTQSANWKTYTITSDPSVGYQIKLPISWKQIEHSSSFQGKEAFQDEQDVFRFVIEEQENYSGQTKKPFVNLKEFSGLPYDGVSLVVDGQQASRLLPRVGSESTYEVLFFSKDVKLVYRITLETPRDGSKIQEGEKLFNQILSTFKFLDQDENLETSGFPVVSDRFVKLISPESGTEWKTGGKYSIKWEQKALENRGNVVEICLTAVDQQKKVIMAKDKWKKEICTIYAGDATGNYLIAETRLTNEQLDWIIPKDLYERFEKVPSYFKISLLVYDNLPSEGRSEWGGLIEKDESSYFKVIN